MTAGPLKIALKASLPPWLASSSPGFVAGLDGSRLLRRDVTAAVDNDDAAQELGQRLVGLLLDDGCHEVLDEVFLQAGRSDSEPKAGA